MSRPELLFFLNLLLVGVPYFHVAHHGAERGFDIVRHGEKQSMAALDEFFCELLFPCQVHSRFLSFAKVVCDKKDDNENEQDREHAHSDCKANDFAC